jgi:hypothetical protein
MMTLRSLERFTVRLRREAESERCEVCSAPIGAAHRHVVDRTDRRLLCACSPCALTFSDPKAARFRAVSDRVRDARRTGPTAADLRALGVPIGLAFFFRGSSIGRWVGVFPSPAGPTEAELPEAQWNDLVTRTPLLSEIEDDVEALLVRTERDGTHTAFVVPIDVCYQLVGILRRAWRGIDGGNEAREALDTFFAELAERKEKAS